MLEIKGPKSLGLHTLYDCCACTIYDAMFYGNWIKHVDLGKVFGQNRVFDENSIPPLIGCCNLSFEEFIIYRNYPMQNSFFVYTLG